MGCSASVEAAAAPPPPKPVVTKTQVAAFEKRQHVAVEAQKEAEKMILEVREERLREPSSKEVPSHPFQFLKTTTTTTNNQQKKNVVENVVPPTPLLFCFLKVREIINVACVGIRCVRNRKGFEHIVLYETDPAPMIIKECEKRECLFLDPEFRISPDPEDPEAVFGSQTKPHGLISNERKKDFEASGCKGPLQIDLHHVTVT